MFSLKRLKAWLWREAHRLLRLHDTPHAIAGGAAIGIFFGFTPLIGLKTLLGIAVAWAFRCSKVAAAIGVALHDIVIPFMPVVLRGEYGVGVWLLSHPHRWPEHFKIDHLHIHQLLHWDVLVELIWPTLLGSLLVGLPIAAVSFWVILGIVSRAQARQVEGDAAALGIDLEEK
ncbi:MAG: DUF2062 domain-containing protein [Chthoniobacteraceae bacterium]